MVGATRAQRRFDLGVLFCFHDPATDSSGSPLPSKRGDAKASAKRPWQEAVVGNISVRLLGIRAMRYWLLAAVGACAPSAGSARPTVRATALVAPLDSIAFYIGHWRCKGTEYTDDRPVKTWDAIVDVAPELDGRWVSVHMSGPGDNETSEHKGYDPVAKRWIHVAVTNAGSWGVISSPGWTGAQMVFTGSDPKDDTHTVFTKLSDRAYSHAVVQSNGDKVWDKLCAKS
jgi:hypothetical protein